MIQCFCDQVQAMMAGQAGFFDPSDSYAALIAAGDPLERLVTVVDFEQFRMSLIVALRRGSRNKGGRPLFDPDLMCKILVLLARYSLSDEALWGRSYLAMGGQLLDASVVTAPNQHNTNGEKAAIRQEYVPAD